jgi:hypothetical protein
MKTKLLVIGSSLVGVEQHLYRLIIWLVSNLGYMLHILMQFKGDNNVTACWNVPASDTCQFVLSVPTIGTQDACGVDHPSQFHKT